MSGREELRERLAGVLAEHHPTTGMAVTMGVTCACGYWTGSEPEAGKRPLPWGRDRLDLHRAELVEREIAAARAEAWRQGAAAGHHSPLTWFALRQVNPYRAEETRHAE